MTKLNDIQTLSFVLTNLVPRMFLARLNHRAISKENPKEGSISNKGLAEIFADVMELMVSVSAMVQQLRDDKLSEEDILNIISEAGEQVDLIAPDHVMHRLMNVQEAYVEHQEKNPELYERISLMEDAVLLNSKRKTKKHSNLSHSVVEMLSNMGILEDCDNCDKAKEKGGNCPLESEMRRMKASISPAEENERVSVIPIPINIAPKAKDIN